MITYKSEAELDKMRESGRLTKNVLELLCKSIRPHMSTKELDEIAYNYIKSCGATPSFLNYCGYPASTCISIDDTVIHGIPSKDIIIKEGQIVSVDVGVLYNGYHGDAARTFCVGEVSPEKRKLVEITEQCFFKAIENLRVGSSIGDIGYKVQTHAEQNGYSVVRAFVGHGIGKEMHEDPSVPNYGKKGTGIRLKSGMTIAIEPMINMGGYQVDFLADGWTIKTKDRKPSAHYENTIAILDSGVEILTL